MRLPVPISLWETGGRKRLRKRGKIEKHDGIIITDLREFISFSYTLEEVVARNYLIQERPNAILNIVDGTNLERNLYLTAQLTELGIR